jgi:hypothetical protein
VRLEVHAFLAQNGTVSWLWRRANWWKFVEGRDYFAASIFHLENVSSIFLQNISKCLQVYTASHVRRRYVSSPFIISKCLNLYVRWLFVTNFGISFKRPPPRPFHPNSVHRQSGSLTAIILHVLISCKMTWDTRWFKYDRDKLLLFYTQIVPVIFEPPCISTIVSTRSCRNGNGLGLMLLTSLLGVRMLEVTYRDVHTWNAVRADCVISRSFFNVRLRVEVLIMEFSDMHVSTYTSL